MKSAFFKKLIAAQLLALSLVLSHIACSRSVFGDLNTESTQVNAVKEVESSTNSAASRSPASIEPSPLDDFNKPVVEGYATGVRSEGTELQWENWGLYGTHIQIQYSISEFDSYHTAFQVFPKNGAEEILNAATDQGLLAAGSDERPFAFAQYTNLEKSLGFHTFDLPLKYAYANGVKQYLKVGDYKLFITACKTTKSASCHKSQAIAFSVKN